MYTDYKKTLKTFLVDDNVLTLKMQEDYLNSRFGRKLNISTFKTGEDCLGAISASEPDLVVLDYNLDSQKSGAANGLEILKKIRKHHENVDVIMLSGQAKIDIAVETMRMGAKDYIEKGETSSFHLEQIVKGILTNAKQLHELKSYKLGFWLAVSLLSVITISTLVLYFFFPEYTKHLPL